ncbi:protein SHQ1 homolog [Nerophis lumbriciformis]|uniref:protein SHQ1 homolog n=1 Tax=Nerophis lumbriciformis TaxID=546530 RepID=UPI002AE081FB|nr:protein SHQ1 homolog [Nerophis lumbriciformis]XP_061779936.1 protein SHQ1 homolog [Nerophis lumbriciformis]XP_061779937.1 protein SHQ1 homolog [Nerophis lumbriciformis]
MITPMFDLSQDAEYLILSIRVPYTRTSEFDLFIDGTDVKFYAKPYFLRLTLPGRVVEDGREKATFDIDKGLFTVQIPKETSGEHFEGLQMLTSLLAPKGSRSAKPLLEDISPDCGESAGTNEGEDEEDFDWQVEQEVYKERSEEELRSMQKYGFGNQRSGVFARLQEELSDVIDVKDPDGTTLAKRRQERLNAEASAFSPDHYLADLFEDDEIKRLLKFKPWWTKCRPSPEHEGEAAILFSDDEKEQMRKFTNRSYLLDKTSRYQVWLSLVDILLAYAYEVRSTEGDYNVESPWAIRKLSGTLCWLETYSSLQEVLVSFGRRVLCYPLYRHFDMVAAAIYDIAGILQSGKACVLKCLLDIHKVFRKNDPSYILNDLYITDYCIWIQRIKSKKLSALAATLQKASLQKKDLELELEELEEAASMVAEEEGSSKSASGSVCSDSNSSQEDEECATPGGGGGESSKDSPLHPSSLVCAIPQQSVTLPSADGNVDAFPPASEGTRPLIQELGELRITQDARSSPEEERKLSQAKTSAAAEGTLLEPSQQNNALLIIKTQEDSSPDGLFKM